MAGGYAQVPRWALTAVGAAALLSSGMALSACSHSAAPAAHTVPSVGASSASTPTRDAVAAKAAVDKAAAKQIAAVKAAAAKFHAITASGERAAAKAHTISKAAAACGIPVGYLKIGASRIGPPDVPRRGDMWRVKATSPISPGMIIYWPDGGSVLCR